jgi:hypothetical protein
MNKALLLLAVALAGCEVNGATAPVDPAAPTDLAFQLQPSGDPNLPLGVLLTWVAPSNGRAVSYDVYGRSANTGWQLRATTTSTSFHDIGAPESQYYVVALDDQSGQMGQSTTITIDLTSRLPAPLSLTSITLNSAIQLSWSNNAVQAGGTGGLSFDHYRVYSSDYSSARSTCVEPWYFEGSTVSDAFIVGDLTNGSSRCFVVSAVSRDGHESAWSSPRTDTPRQDATSVVAYAAETRSDSVVFVFNDEVARVLGIVGPSIRVDADFMVNRQADGTIWLTPSRTGSSVRTFASTPISSLTAIDRAPIAGYQSSAVQATPGTGYVFRLDEADGTHYGALRVQYLGPTFVIFDWSYQIGAGNPELSTSRQTHLIDK